MLQAVNTYASYLLNVPQWLFHSKLQHLYTVRNSDELQITVKLMKHHKMWYLPFGFRGRQAGHGIFLQFIQWEITCREEAQRRSTVQWYAPNVSHFACKFQVWYKYDYPRSPPDRYYCIYDQACWYRFWSGMGVLTASTQYLAILMRRTGASCTKMLCNICFSVWS